MAESPDDAPFEGGDVPQPRTATQEVPATDEREEPRVELALREPKQPAPLMGEYEIANIYRIARALALSGLYKDVTRAEQAFAKIMVGRDLGLSPAQSLTLDVIEGSVEAPAVMWANFIRQRPGYDYKVTWVKKGETDNALPVETDESDPNLYGCRITFMVDDEVRGTYTWTQADTVRADLGNKANHKRYPRAMYYSRAMSAGAKVHVPEVMEGLPVYAQGELDRPMINASFDGTAVEIAPPSAGWPPLHPEVEAVVDRARKLGHAALANRESAAARLQAASAEDRALWVTQSMATLDRLAAEGRAEVEELSKQEKAQEADLPLEDPDPIEDPHAELERLQERLQGAEMDGDALQVEEIMGLIAVCQDQIEAKKKEES